MNIHFKFADNKLARSPAAFYGRDDFARDEYVVLVVNKMSNTITHIVLRQHVFQRYD